MALSGEQADVLRSIAAEVLMRLEMCRQGLLADNEAANIVRATWSALQATTDESSVEWRIFDKGRRQTMWWMSTHDSYVDPKDCKHLEAVLTAIDDALSAGTGRRQKDYRSLLEQVELLKTIVTARATGAEGDDRAYRRLRGTLLADDEVAPLLPRFVRTARNMDEVWAVMKGVATGSGSYALRQQYVLEVFDPVKTLLEGRAATGVGSPHSDHVEETLEAFGATAVERLWRKALGRVDSAPEGALTAGRPCRDRVQTHPR